MRSRPGWGRRGHGSAGSSSAGFGGGGSGRGAGTGSPSRTGLRTEHNSMESSKIVILLVNTPWKRFQGATVRYLAEDAALLVKKRVR